MVTLDQLNKYCCFLNSSGYDATVENNKIKVTTLIEKYSVVLWCNLGKHFPYELPDIQIDEESYKDLPKMPHTFTNKNICTFDRNLIIPNFEEPEKIIRDVLAKAISIIKDGINGDNLSDYIDEFSEYWKTKSKEHVELFVENTDAFKTLYYCVGTPKIMSDDINKLSSIYKSNIGKELSSQDIKEAFLVPLDAGIPNIIPNDDIDILNIIKTCSSSFDKYEEFINRNFSRKNIIIFKLYTGAGEVLQAWRHKYPQEVKGFRVGHFPVSLAFKQDKEKGHAVQINDCSQKRLFTRGGTGDTPAWKKVGIIGCGSIGGFLAASLASSGVNEFVLVDNDIMTHENIARHFLGYHDIGKYKSSALSLSLQTHNPNITCEVVTDNVHSIFEEDADKLNSCDVLFVAVASTSVEYRINKLIIDGIIKVPVIFMWLEPYALGGHVVILRKAQNLYSEIFDKYNFSFKDSIVKNSNAYMKREGGCQSSYMPYSGLSVQQFVTRLVEVVATEYWHIKGNYQITWCGKLKSAESLGIEINDSYINCEEHSIIVKRFD